MVLHELPPWPRHVTVSVSIIDQGTTGDTSTSLCHTSMTMACSKHETRYRLEVARSCRTQYSIPPAIGIVKIFFLPVVLLFSSFAAPHKCSSWPGNVDSSPDDAFASSLVSNGGGFNTTDDLIQWLINDHSETDYKVSPDAQFGFGECEMSVVQMGIFLTV